MRSALINYYEFQPREKQADWYRDLPEIMAFQQLSREEIDRRTEIWTKYYESVRQTSPAAQLFREWKAYMRGTSSMTLQQLKNATEDMKLKGVPAVPNRPKFRDPIELMSLMTQAEINGRGLLKRESSKPRKWED